MFFASFVGWQDLLSDHLQAFWFYRFDGMAVEKSLNACQKFLAGVRSLSSFEDIRQKQALGVSKAIEKVPAFSAGQAASFLGQLQLELWAPSHIEGFREKVAARTKPLESDQIRMVAQDFGMLPHFLTDELAAQIGQKDVNTERLMFQLCHHAALLGLRQASEGTKATLVVMAHWSSCQRGNLAPKEQYELFCRHKPAITKYLIAPADVPLLSELPVAWQDLDGQLLRKVFPTGKPADMGEVSKEICEFVRRMPLRKDNRLLQDGASKSVLASAGFSSGTLAVDDVCKVVAACSQSFQAQAERLQFSHAAASVERGSQSLLAICDAPAPEAATKAVPEQDLGGPKTMTVEEQLSLLRGEMDKNQGKESEQEGETHLRMRKPAAAKAAPKPRGRPRAAPKPKGRPRAKPKADSSARKPLKPSRKRPASATARRGPASTGARPRTGSRLGTSTGSLSSGKMSRAQRRANVLATVPRKLRLQFKGGCPTCRWTAGCSPSCWFKKGFDV